MKHNWEIKKLGEVCHILNGFAFKSINYLNDGIRVIRIANVQKGEIIDSQPQFYPLSTSNEIEKYLLEENDLLVSLTGNVGRVGMMPQSLLPAALNQRVACLRVIKENTVDKRYLFNILNSDYFEYQCIFNAQGIAQKNMSTEWLKTFEIYVPPLTTQQTIVKELDLLNSLIDKQKAQLTEFDRLAQSVFYDMFGDPVENEKGWEVKKLGEVVKPKSAIKRATREIKISEKISYIDISSIDNSINKITTFTEFIFKDAPSRAQQVIEIGDIIISLVRPNLNNVAVLSENYYNSVASSGFCVLRPNSINTQFLFYIVKGDKYRNYLSARTSGANYPAVREEDVKSFDLIIPPLSLQTAFAERIEKIEAQKALVKQSIAQSEQLLASRMQYYFE